VKPYPVAAVLGWPIGHSRSPALHGHWLRRYGIAGAYVPLAVAPDMAEPALRALPALGFAGANVTLPHKELALKVAHSASERALRIGAANTLIVRDGHIEADNTDGFGFIENVRAEAPSWDSGRPALVLGAGGAARAVIDALLAEGVAELRLANRTKARADALASQFGDRVQVVGWDQADEAADGAGLIVNTTSLGMQGQPPLDFGFAAASPDAIATDLVYVPLETPFLAAASARGLKTVDGLGMLLHQARPGFAAWFGCDPDVDGALRDVVLSE
jgi:shikimate dehydrogenase